jgi:hypothetical protein
MKKQNIDKQVSWKKAQEMLKKGGNYVIKIKEGTIYQEGEYRYFIKNDGTIVYPTLEGIRSVKV